MSVDGRRVKSLMSVAAAAASLLDRVSAND